MSTFLLRFSLACALALTAVSNAHAAATLKLTSGATTVTVSDNGPGDSNSAVGAITYVGAVGSNWFLNTTAGRSKPTVGSATQPSLDLGTTSRSLSAGTLTIEFSDDAFGPANGVVTANIGGTIGGGTNSTFSYGTRVSDSNTQFAGVALTDLGPFTRTGSAPTFSFSGSTSQPLGLPAGFALSQKLVIVHTSGGTSGANADMRYVANTPAGKIGDFVWRDDNQNGLQETGEPGINGVTVTLSGPDQLVLTTTTDANGYYQFTGLSAGTYSVAVTTATGPLSGLIPTYSQVLVEGQPAQDVDSNPNPSLVVLATDNSSVQNVDFGFYQYVPPTGRIGNFVWLDANQNGMQDANEQGIGGVTVELSDSANQPITSATTTANGAYAFTGLAAGTYRVNIVAATLPSGLIPTNPNQGTVQNDSNVSPETVVLASDSAVDDSIDFGYIPAPAGSIGDFVWRDLDGDGIQDGPSEPGIPGVLVKLYDSNGGLIAQTTTDDEGLYLFTGLSKGTYTVEVATSLTLEGYVYNLTTPGAANDSGADSNPVPATVVLPLNTSADTTIDFGFTPVPASRIGDLVWNDLNDNGVQDSSEPGIGGVVVSLYSPSDTSFASPLATTTTNANGIYGFDGLRAGSYVVRVETASSSNLTGFIPTTVNAVPNTAADSSASPVTVVVPSNTYTDITVDFGFVKPSGSIGNFVWNDVNFDGVQGPNEPGINGVTVSLLDSSNIAVQTLVTSGNGGYLFSGLKKGTYTVVIDNNQAALAAYQSTGLGSGTAATDSNPNPQAVNLPNNISTDDTIDFGYFIPKGKVGNFVWFDVDQDGVQDPGEPGIANVVVTLFNSSNVQIAQVATDSNGAYLFTGLPKGSYSVAVDNAALLNAGYIPTSTNAGNAAVDSNVNPSPVTLAANDTADLTVDFGFVPTPAGSIGDFVWNDVNGNGRQDPSEPGIANVRVWLDGPNGLHVSTVTDGGGLYLFDRLTAGNYKVTVDANTLPAGFVATPSNASGSNAVNDSNGSPATLTLANNSASNMTIDFGYFKPAPLVLTCPVATATVGIAYSSAAVASGGSQPYVFAIASGSLPPGLTLNSTTGAITGTPNAVGSYGVSIRVTDARGATATSSCNCGCGGGAVSTWNFNTPTGPLATSQTYLVNGVPIVAYGFANDGTPKALYGKSQNSDSGLGIAGTSSDNEISSSTFVQLDLANLISARATSPMIMISGVQSGDAYNIYGSNTLGSIGTLLGSANRTEARNFFALPGFPTYRYISVRAVNSTYYGCYTVKGDVLLAAVSFKLQECCVITVAPRVKCGTIGNFVWKDLNGNGIQDPGEPGLNGVRVNLYGANNALIDSDVTAGDGNYLFTGLGAGTYSVKVDGNSSALSGRVLTQTAAGNDPAVDSNASPVTVTLPSDNSSNLTIDFGYKAKATCGPIYTYRKCGYGYSSKSWCINRDGDWRDCDDDNDRDWNVSDRDYRSNHERSYLEKCFSILYRDGLTVGGNCTLKFTSFRCVENFLPCGGKSGKLTQSQVNPTMTLGELAGEVVALRISVDFSNAGITAGGLASSKFKSGKFSGKTVSYVLSLAEAVLGGAPLPSGISYDVLSDACAQVNDNYEDGYNRGNLIP